MLVLAPMCLNMIINQRQEVKLKIYYNWMKKQRLQVYLTNTQLSKSIQRDVNIMSEQAF